MEKKDQLKKVFAGTFFLTGVLLISAVVLGIGVERGLTQPKFQIAVLFREVGGLAIGAPVALSGVTVGSVSAIDFLDQEIEGRGVKVILKVYEKYKTQLEKSSRFVIKTEGILGEKSIEISRSIDGNRIDLNQPIIGEDPLDVQDLAKLFADTAVTLKETSETISSIIGEMNHISVTTKRVLNRIEQRLIDGNLFKVF